MYLVYKVLVSWYILTIGRYSLGDYSTLSQKTNIKWTTDSGTTDSTKKVGFDMSVKVKFE